MARCKQTPRKSTGPKGVPRHQLAPRYEIGESSNPNTDPQAEIMRLRVELQRAEADRITEAEKIGELKQSMKYLKHQRNQAWAREDASRERVQELEDYVEELEEYAEEADDDRVRLNNLLDPDYQRQVAQNDLGLVMGPDEEEEDPEEYLLTDEDVIDEDEYVEEEENLMDIDNEDEESEEEEDPEIIEEEFEEEEDPEELIPVTDSEEDE